MYSTFINYTEEDSLLAKRLYAELLAAGIRPWAAAYDIAPGDDENTIEQQAMQNSEAMILLISKKFLRNPIAVDLMNEAQQLGKQLIPVVADRGVDVPEGMPAPIQLKKRYGEAVQEIINQLKADGEPMTDLPLLQQGNEAYFDGEYEEALKLYKQLKEETAESLNSLGAAYNALRRHEEALDVLNRAQALDPNLPKIYRNRSLALSGLGRHEEALADDQRGLELEPDSAKVWSSHAMTLYALDRFDEALDAVKKAMELDPDAAHHFYQWGLIAVKAGQLDEALQAVEQALNLEPDNPDAASLRQIVLGRAGRADEALEAIDRVIKKNPRQGGNYITRSLTNFYLERYEDAVADATKALERGQTQTPAPFYNRAIAHWKLGQVEAAQNDLLQAAELYAPLKTAAGIRASAESELTRDAGLAILASLENDDRLKA